MISKYIVLFEKTNQLPDRQTWVEKSWGYLPTSYSQDNEDLNKATYLDVKVNKWELNNKWSSSQLDEPIIRIEMIRGKSLAEFAPTNDLQEGQDPTLLLIFELEGDGVEVDYNLFVNLISELVKKQNCFVYDESNNGVNKAELIQKSISSNELKTKILSK